jgi:DNA mismatch repair protein MutS
MHETAFILNTATEKSLVIMDEVGRGTGTLDGVSIAWAVSEYLIKRISCRTLFATHYHELTTMAIPGMRNMRMVATEQDGNISFPKRLEDGASSGSYGIHVANLAGLPKEVIIRASEVESHFNSMEQALKEEKLEETAVPSYELFSTEDIVIETLKNIDPNNITPIKALQILSDLVERLKQ